MQRDNNMTMEEGISFEAGDCGIRFFDHKYDTISISIGVPDEVCDGTIRGGISYKKIETSKKKCFDDDSIKVKEFTKEDIEKLESHYWELRSKSHVLDSISYFYVCPCCAMLDVNENPMDIEYSFNFDKRDEQLACTISKEDHLCREIIL